MVMEAFGTCKWFLHLPYISSAGWVGTVMHGNLARMGKQRQNNGTCEVAGPGGTRYKCYECEKIKSTETSEKIWRGQHNVLRNMTTVRGWSKNNFKKKMS